ncbi:energy transducer TonB [[Pseudomonas] boreopolis]|uniref:energy transducer TonB n=1 Tax=Xanthomonas boreopolis TaxID=86183 RepID=UPI003D532B8F
MPARRSPAPRFAFRLPRETWKIAGIAFGLGVLCFVLVWLVARKDDPAAATTAPAQDAARQQPDDALAPLPAPLAAGDDGAADMPGAKPAEDASGDEAPKLVETAPPPPPAPAEPAPAPAPAGTAANLPEDRPLPIQGQMPPPTYPPAALRRGESGTVVVRVDVDANGVPVDVALVQRSGSRDLDRAAMDAVRDWHFRPAHRDGRPVPGSIDVPFDFKPGQ